MGQCPASLHPDTGVCQQKKLDLADDFRDARDMQTQPVPRTWNSVIWGADHLHQYHVLSMLDVLMCRWLRRSGKELQHGLSIRHPYYHVHKMLNFPLAKGNNVAGSCLGKDTIVWQVFLRQRQDPRIAVLSLKRRAWPASTSIDRSNLHRSQR